MRVLIIGANGQDGSILMSKFLELGAEVCGLSKEPHKHPQGDNLAGYYQRLTNVDLSSKVECARVLDQEKFDIIFHVAAVHASSSTMVRLGQESFDEMHRCHVLITKNILEWQSRNLSSKLIVALSSQMYSPQLVIGKVDESTEISPSSRYGETKAEAFSLIRDFRLKFGVSVGGAILFNHTSRFSKREFLFQNIAEQIAQVILGNATQVILRNPNSLLDICAAEDVCDGLISMSKLSILDDFVFSSGAKIVVQSVIDDVLEALALKGKIEVNASESNTIVPDALVGDPSKAHKILGWRLNHTPAQILEAMVYAQLSKLRN